MIVSCAQICCGKIATLTADRVVVARPQSVGDPPTASSAYVKQLHDAQQVRAKLMAFRAVAGALLSSERLSQPLSERS